jgi:1,4-dihydroxy-2-naphthoyl-CoA synthase
MATTQAVEQKELVHYRIEESVGIIEMDDPPANTYTYEMMQQLDTAILRARMDEAVHVIVLRGAGEKFFSAGASIPMLSKVDPQFKYYFCLHANETLSRLEQTPKLVIAALNERSREDRTARSQPGRAAWHRRNAEAFALYRPGARSRADGHRAHLQF